MTTDTDRQIDPLDASIAPKPDPRNDREYVVVRNGRWVYQTAPSEAEFRAKALWHLRAVSAVLVLSAVVTVALLAWIALDVLPA